MSIQCPTQRASCKVSGRIVRYGRFYRTSDRKWIPRFKCTSCSKYFSQATNSPCFGQKKRHLNIRIRNRYVDLCSLRRIARRYKIHTTTVARKVKFLGLQARLKNYQIRQKRGLITELQFDDLETIEHTKLKPLSVTLAVEKTTRYIVGFEVSRMPAKGLLAKKSIKKYGFRKDERRDGRTRLFRRIREKIAPGATIQSDENPHYINDVKEFFPDCLHLPVKGQRGTVTGQGELKKVRYDPIFSLNQSFAMLRANINRLIRKTWNTTKKMQPLIDHIELYVWFHNTTLIKQKI